MSAAKDVLRAHLNQEERPRLVQLNLSVTRELKRQVADTADQLGWSQVKVVTVAVEMLIAALKDIKP